MSNFDIELSIERAARRLAQHHLPVRPRRQRTDAGSFRMDPEVETALRIHLLAQERPVMVSVLRDMEAVARRLGARAPSRATVYSYLGRAPAHFWHLSELPPEVSATLHNVDQGAPIPGWQVAFRALQDGDERALCWVAGMPWWDLWQARRCRGWRPRSLGLIQAICRTRGIR